MNDKYNSWLVAAGVTTIIILLWLAAGNLFFSSPTTEFEPEVVETELAAEKEQLILLFLAPHIDMYMSSRYGVNRFNTLAEIDFISIDDVQKADGHSQSNTYIVVITVQNYIVNPLNMREETITFRVSPMGVTLTEIEIPTSQTHFVE